MNLTPRLKQIIIIMLENTDVIAVKELAARIGVSKRTVQRELEYLGSDLKPYHIEFETKTGKGVWLSGSPEDREKLLSELKQGDSYDATNREERRKRLILEILKEKGLKKLFYYSSQFQVSEATISTDLEAIEGWLADRQLSIIRKPGSGVTVVGTEESYRSAIRAFIEENIDTGLIREAYEVAGDTEGMKSVYGSGIGRILKEDTLKRVIRCINHIGDRRMLTLTENSYMGLVLHISIAINRILQNEIIENDKWQKKLQDDDDLRLARLIVGELETEFSVEIPDIEVTYICLHIKGAKHQNIGWNGQKSMDMERRELLQLVNKMIEAYDSENALLLKQDNDFIQGLLAHLQPTFVRLKYNMKISNPVLEDIKQSYPDDFLRSQRVGKVLEEWVGKPVPEEEVGFLTIHFGAAKVRLEGRKENIRVVSVGIICASGIGISRLMLSKLGKVFKDRIQMETYGQNDITSYIEGKTDFFVSSIACKKEDVDILQVNPLLNEDDMEKIRMKIFHYERIPGKQKKENEFTLQMEEVNILASQIKTIIKYMELIRVSNDITFSELVGAIAEKMTPYGDRQLVIQEDIETRERMGSQIFAEFGFALLHTRTKGVTRPGFHVCMTKDKAAFNNPYFKGINVVLVMLIPMDEYIKVNSEILGYISSALIEDYDFLMTIQEGDKEAIRDALSTHLRTFFSQYLNRF